MLGTHDAVTAPSRMTGACLPGPHTAAPITHVKKAKQQKKGKENEKKRASQVFLLTLFKTCLHTCMLLLFPSAKANISWFSGCNAGRCAALATLLLVCSAFRVLFILTSSPCSPGGFLTTREPNRVCQRICKVPGRTINVSRK